MTTKLLMDVTELSNCLSLPKATIYTWVQTGRIPRNCVVRLGRSLRFHVPAIEAWVQRSRQSETRGGRRTHPET